MKQPIRSDNLKCTANRAEEKKKKRNNENQTTVQIELKPKHSAQGIKTQENRALVEQQ